jgi:CRISPR/Cas system-associated exonuclease Cas4 (RecB family)
MINFSNLIDQHLKRELKQKTIGRYYPSEVGGCLRKTWYSYKYPKEVDKELLKIFQVGEMLHDFLAEVLRSDKTQDVRLIESEFPFKMDMDDFTISGRVDDILIVEKDGKKVLVEVKSVKMIEMVDEPRFSHEMQIQLYMNATGIHDGLLVYVEKSSLQIKQFEIKYDKDIVNYVIERFRNLHKHLIENTLPSPEAKQRDDMKWMCKRCEYKEMCDRSEK